MKHLVIFVIFFVIGCAVGLEIISKYSQEVVYGERE